MKNNLLVKGVSIATVLTLGVITASPVLAYTKDETVYGKMSNSGENYNTVVSTHLKNTENESILKDISDLLNIKNVNGDETFEANENILKWNSNGNDIYYQGDTEKELPLECTIKYELDGNEISAEELAGKSGKVKITIEYKNKDEHIVKINGKNTKMYTPFVVITGTILNNTVAKNITISNGKIVDNGTKTLVAAVTCPGLQESLDLDEKDLEIPSKVELEFEATDFEMGNIMSYATPKLIEESDLDNLNKILSKIVAMNVDGVLYYDDSILELKIENNYNINLYINKNYMMTNSSTINFYHKYGVKGVVLSNEITLDEIKMIRENTKLEIMQLVIGYPVVATSRRSLNTNSGNLERLEVIEPKSRQHYKLIEDEFGTSFISLKRFNGCKYLKDINLDYGIVYQDDLDNDTVNKLVEDIKTNNIKEIDELVGRNRGFLNRKTIYKVVR